MFTVLFTHIFYQSARVQNKCDRKIKALSEDDGEIIEVNPGCKAIGIVGVKINGKVYKLTDGIYAKITKEGNLKIKTIMGNLLNRSAGDLLLEAPNSIWQKLFDAE